MDDIIGIDISKATLDAFRRSSGEHRQFPNDPAGCKALVRWLGIEPQRVLFEPTGPYHRGLELALVNAGLHTIKVNPRSERRFAEATGVLAKTDRIDARVLAGMGAILDLKGRPAKTEIQYDLKELSVARQALVKDRVAAKNRMHAAVNTLIKRQLAARIKQIWSKWLRSMLQSWPVSWPIRRMRAGLQFSAAFRVLERSRAQHS